MDAWPDRFIYLCSATRGAAVNVMPLVHAGLGRVARVIVLCGAEPGNHADAKADSEARVPAARLAEFAEKYSEGRLRRGRDIDIRYANPHDMAAWQHEVSKASRTKEELPIVFNIKGGTKEMAVGALMALTDSPNLRVITVPNDLLRVETVTGSERCRMQANAHLTLSMYLDAYGLVETDPVQRAKWEEFCKSKSEAIDAFAAAVLTAPDALCSALNSMNQKFWYRSNFVVQTVDPASPTFTLSPRNRGLFTGALQVVSSFPGCTRSGDALRVTDESTARFLTGTWLEAYIYNRVCAALAKISDMEVRANVELSFGDRLVGPRSSIGEIDVAIVFRSQLVIIEAKTIEMSAKAAKKNRETAFSQLATLRQQLQGQAGHTFLVNPRSADSVAGPESGDIAKRAAESGIATLFGVTAVDDLVARLHQIVAASAP